MVVIALQTLDPMDWSETQPIDVTRREEVRCEKQRFKQDVCLRSSEWWTFV